MTDYYLANGTPPGQWFGRGAALMGVSGEVTEAQMRALYGEGIHPNADQIILGALDEDKSVDQALDAARLGTGHAAFGHGPSEITALYERDKAGFLAEHRRPPDREEWLDLRAGAAKKHLLIELGRPATVEEINAALADEKRVNRSPVVAYDMVATWTKSESIAWALADDQTRQIMWQADLEAVRETFETAQDKYALARRGAGGKRVIDAEGFTIAMYRHFDNRCGDPNAHTHVVVSARVRGADGRWCALDARALYQATVSLSCEYNARRIGKIKRRTGFRYEPNYRNGVHKAPVLEIAGIPEGLIKLFSRRPDILTETENLVREYRQTHGRNPSKKTQIHLAQQATLSTREGKPIPRSLLEMFAEWAARTEAFLGDGRTCEQFMAEVIHLNRHPDAPRRYDAHQAAVTAGIALGGAEEIAHATRSEVRRAVDTALDRFILAADQSRGDAIYEVIALLDPGNDNNLLEHVDRAVAFIAQSVYDPAAITADVLHTVSRRRATWTETHIRAAVEDRVSLCDFPTDDAQREAVEWTVVCVRDQLSILLTVDPDPVPKALARRTGEHVFSPCAATTVRYTSEGVLAAETALREAAVTATPEFLTTRAVDTAIAEIEQSGGRTLNAGQRQIVRHLCTSGARLAVAIGPAGTGKTTAMKAVAHAWQSDGRTVIALAPQKKSAGLLGEEIGVPARTIDNLLTLVRHGGDAGIEAGTMLLVDEAGMSSTHNLAELQVVADAYGAVVRWIGDPQQLSAVESGGALRLIASDTRAPQLAEVVRFDDPREAAASLKVRDGDARAAWEFYKTSGRVVSGMADELREQILTAHLADVEDGIGSLMMAATLDDVHALNGAAQAAHALRGHVATQGPGAELADGHTAYLGDVVVTRKNTSRLRITGGRRAGDPIDNGEQWTVRTVHSDGSLTIGGIDHHGRVHLPARYVADSTELGYASTVHRAQGMTVQRAYTLMGAALGRSLAYVGLTRGSERNMIYLATDVLPDPHLDHQPAEPLTDYEVWLRELAREDDNRTATETLRTVQARLDDPDRLREIYDHARDLLARERVDYLLDRALPVALLDTVTRSQNYLTLRDTLDLAEQTGIDTVALIGHITTNGWRDDGQTLAAANDAAALLRARADRYIADHLHLAHDEQSGTFLAVRDLERPDVAPVPPRFPGMDAELADYASALRARLLGGEELAALEANPARVLTAVGELADALAVDSDLPDPAARMARLREDYDHYVGLLARDFARYRLDQVLPAEVLRHVEDGPDYDQLLDTIARAEADGMDTAAMVAWVAGGDRDSRASLLRAPDAAARLTRRAQAWIDHHGEPASADAPARPALTPIPPTHPGQDRAVAEHAADLRHQIDDLTDRPVRERLLADPIRMLTDTGLRARIGQLRREVTGPDPTAVLDLVQGTPVADVQASHAGLDAQHNAIRAAQLAQQAANIADHRVREAHQRVVSAQDELDALPGFRRSARRDAEATLDAAAATRQRITEQARTAHRDADTAVRAATTIGAHPARWTEVLAAATDSEARARELDTAHAAQARTQTARARRATQRAATAEQLTAALAEHDRRRHLSPTDIAAERRIRRAHTRTEAENDDLEPEFTAPVQPEIGRDPEHGVDL